MLKRKGHQAQRHNAKHHEKEAEIVAEDVVRAATIATNMADGTDIILGVENPDFEARREMRG